VFQGEVSFFELTKRVAKMQRAEKKPNRFIPRPALGWPLFPLPVNGILTYPTLEHSIKQYIQVVLLTKPGEQLMRAQFGGGLSEYLHKANTMETRQQIQDAVEDALNRWERRIILDQVDVVEEKAPGSLRIEIAYLIKRTGNKVTTMVKMHLGN
jgi:phage baseplate assembly protein W